ncbi:hypothetical protein [Cupriavidus sp. YR651]|uniref:DUF6984 family protein n=1 Tax=Cupriavidus sp. YR651 TaxID=1855315 RepID=UPI001C408F5C|nr:hypothetical protein [Cupriavidus sp. YR651]
MLRQLGEIGLLRGTIDTLLAKQVAVKNLEDGRMGSFRIISSSGEFSQCWRMVASAKSNDLDGTLLVATLFVDEDGIPCEVDIWKVDFSALIELPEKWEPEDFPRFPGSGTGI